MCLVRLTGGGKFEITQSKYRLTEEQKQEDGQKLFDFCGECLKAFTDLSIENGAIKKEEVLPLGFTVRLIVLPFFLVMLTLICGSVLVSMLVSVEYQIAPFLCSCSTHAHFINSRQDRIDHGALIRWTKGFGAPNTEGHDVVEMFRKSLSLHVRAAPSVFYASLV